MSYKDEYHPKVKSDLKKMDHAAVRDFAEAHIERLLQNPHGAEKLHGALKDVFSYHFKKNRVEYRVAYTIDEAKKVVYVIMAGKRENFYEILKRRLL